MPKMLDCQSFRFNPCYHDPEAVRDCKMKCTSYKSKYIKLFCQCAGDPSVGIWGDTAEVLIERRFIEREDSQEMRDLIRNTFTSLFKAIFDDEATQSQFEDECWGCNQLNTDCRCPKE